MNIVDFINGTYTQSGVDMLVTHALAEWNPDTNDLVLLNKMCTCRDFYNDAVLINQCSLGGKTNKHLAKSIFGFKVNGLLSEKLPGAMQNEYGYMLWSIDKNSASRILSPDRYYKAVNDYINHIQNTKLKHLNMLEFNVIPVNYTKGNCDFVVEFDSLWYHNHILFSFFTRFIRVAISTMYFEKNHDLDVYDVYNKNLVGLDYASLRKSPYSMDTFVAFANMAATDESVEAHTGGIELSNYQDLYSIHNAGNETAAMAMHSMVNEDNPYVIAIGNSFIDMYPYWGEMLEKTVG